MGFYRIRAVPAALSRRPVMFFDLDNTLYPRDPLKFNSRRLAVQFLMEKKGFDAVRAEKIMTAYRERYNGMPVLGLVKEQGLSALEYERYIHTRSNLPWLLRPDRRLHKMLGSMNAQRFVLTNAGLDHTVSALTSLGILHQFHGIVYVDYSSKTILTKPNIQVYKEAMRIVKVRDPRQVYFIDDEIKYTRGARKLGWNTLWLDTVHRNRFCPDPNFPCIKSIYDLPRTWPNLFA